MTAFVRLSNKKHLQHASRHAELHFSDGLCIMAHSPKALLLTFHLLVRKSHYQHKMNFLKLEAYPLLARIRQLLPVLGQCLMYFIAAVFLLVASNAALTGSLHGLLGKASHTALARILHEPQKNRPASRSVFLVNGCVTAKKNGHPCYNFVCSKNNNKNDHVLLFYPN